jgi:prepilin-type N-terminal cleavage/methylation domain-containing protein
MEQIFPNLKEKKEAFTLVEVMVSLIIVGILAGIGFSLTRIRGGSFLLQRSAQKVAQDIRKVEHMALAAKLIQFPGDTEPIIPEAYGVYFDTSIPENRQKYLFFADGKVTFNRFYDSGENFQNVELESGTRIEKLQVCNTNCESESSWNEKNSLSIAFRPPDPEITLKDASGNLWNEGRIIVSLTIDPNKTRKIRVNKWGKIEVE